MPAFCTHYLFFEDSKEFMCSLADFPLNEKVCALGSQGADIFFFHKIYFPLHSKRKIGSALHRQRNHTFTDSFCTTLSTADVIRMSTLWRKKSPTAIKKSITFPLTTELKWVWTHICYTKNRAQSTHIFLIQAKP